MVRARFWICLLMLASIASSQGAPPLGDVDESKPYGRIALIVDDEDAAEHRETLGHAVQKGARCGVRALADANRSCTLVLAAFHPNKRMVRGWNPQVVDIVGFGENDAPAKTDVLVRLDKVGWTWTAPAEPFEVWALFLPREAKAAATFKELAKTLSKKTAGAPAQIAGEFRREMAAFAPFDPTGYRVTLKPWSIAGSTRSLEDAWRDVSCKRNYGPQDGILFVLPSEGSGDAKK